MEAKVEQGKMSMEKCDCLTRLETVKLACTERVYTEGDEPSGFLAFQAECQTRMGNVPVVLKGGQ